jgi:hypothetical protein
MDIIQRHALCERVKLTKVEWGDILPRVQVDNPSIYPISLCFQHTEVEGEKNHLHF